MTNDELIELILGENPSEVRVKALEEYGRRDATSFSFFCRSYHNCGDSGWGCLCREGENFITIEEGFRQFKEQEKSYRIPKFIPYKKD